jgi:histidyl-tRNA synthetase
MAKKVSTKPPSGMRDFLPADIARRNYVVGIVREIYERYGFVPLETPSIENLEILLGKYGEDEKLIYRLLHRGETLQRAIEAHPSDLGADHLSDLALRYDLTVPLARVVAQYGDLPRYFKRYQIQPVWRADRPGKGRFREFYQCDVDITGTKSLLAEAEVCGAACEVLERLGFSDYVLQINHRQLLRALIRTAGIDAALESTALVAVDKLDKIGREGVAAELGQRGIGEASAARLLDLIGRLDDGDDVVELLRAQMDDEAGVAALDELVELTSLLEGTPAGSRARIVPKLARGLGYYTGAIFEIAVPDLGSSIAGGGRYDELVGMFGKQAIPAVGLSLGLERILVVMAEREMYPALRSGPEVLLCWRGVEPHAVLQTAHVLRAQGLRVEVFPEPTKLGKQVQYADSPGVAARFAGIVGESELDKGEITLKHLASGDQATLPLDQASAHVRARGD